MRYVAKFVLFLLVCGVFIGLDYANASATSIQTSSDELSYRASGALAGSWLNNRSAPDSSRTFLQVNPILVTLIPPTTVPVCGSNNDEVVFPEQVGAVVEYDSGWADGTRSITYVSLRDYYIDGFNGRYTFGLIDSGTPCQLTAPLEPTQTAVCGPNNDIITIPAQPAGIVLATDTMWVGNARTVTFGATAGFVIEGQSVFEFTDANVPCPPETPTPSPIVTPDPVVTPTVNPDTSPTGVPLHEPRPADKSAPLASSVGSAKVTGLPNTGSGEGKSSGLLALTAIGAVLMALPVVRRSRL